MSNFTNFPGDHDDTVLRAALVRDLEQIKRARTHTTDWRQGVRARDHQAGEMNGLTMAIALVRGDPEDPLLQDLDRMMTHEYPVDGTMIPDTTIPFNPRPPQARPL